MEIVSFFIGISTSLRSSWCAFEHYLITELIINAYSMPIHVVSRSNYEQQSNNTTFIHGLSVANLFLTA